MSGLAGLFSTLDALKRKVSDTAQNPILALQQLLGNANDKARDFNELNSQATVAQEKSFKGQQPSPQEQVAAQQLMEALANGYNPAGMTLWHGSPYSFRKFDAAKIGTGEGAQAYGHGLYLAEKKDVSLPYMKPAYRDMVGASIDGKPVNSLNLSYGQYIGARAADRAGGIPQAIEKYTSEVNDALARGDTRYAEAMQEVLDSVKALPGKTMQRSEDAAKNLLSGHNGFLYKVDLPDEHIAKMLDWDKPLSQQAPEVQKALADEAQKYINRRAEVPDAGMIVRAMQPPERFGGSAAVSEMLRQQGIPGIRYLDGGSRGAGQGTSNFVVFPGREDLLKILERNGLPVK